MRGHKNWSKRYTGPSCQCFFTVRNIWMSNIEHWLLARGYLIERASGRPLKECTDENCDRQICKSEFAEAKGPSEGCAGKVKSERRGCGPVREKTAFGAGISPGR